MHMTTVCLLGYGEIGKALDAVLSRNADIGIERWDKNIDIFARGLPPLRGSEALNTLPCIMQSMPTIVSDLPFLRAIHDVVIDGKSAQDTIARLLA